MHAKLIKNIISKYYTLDLKSHVTAFPPYPAYFQIRMRNVFIILAFLLDEGLGKFRSLSCPNICTKVSFYKFSIRIFVRKRTMSSYHKLGSLQLNGPLIFQTFNLV